MMANFEGYNDDNKPSSKVLRPPGGGSSDIFGNDLPQTPRNVKNHMQSHIFTAEKNSTVKNNGDQPRRAQKNVDSYTRLFGQPEQPVTPIKNTMRSNIAFGANNPAAAQILTNGNGHHHSNGKSGSVSSASSSVSSSTENLKMNGTSKTEFDDACPASVHTSSESTPRTPLPLDIDLPCDDKCVASHSNNLSARSATDDMGAGDIASQTSRDSGCNPVNQYSLPKMSSPSVKKEPLDACVEKHAPVPTPRNPITGLGLGGDGVGGIKPKKPKDRRDGNPVTGEGYKGSDHNSSIPSFNGANQVINKNRIPPGGFSSGLW